MKKIAVICMIGFCILLCSCTKDTTGYSYELASSSWQNTFESGAEVELNFDSDIASLTINNGDLTSNIKGKYIADDERFVIFVPEISQNYSFEYIPKGKSLQLKYGDYTITLNKK